MAAVAEVPHRLFAYDRARRSAVWIVTTKTLAGLHRLVNNGKTFDGEFVTVRA